MHRVDHIAAANNKTVGRNHSVAKPAITLVPAPVDDFLNDSHYWFVPNPV
jgi:hypothetical protein